MEINKLREEIAKLRDLGDRYDEAKKISNGLDADYKSQEIKLKQIFEDMELDSFEGVSVYTKASCKIPQDPMDKQALFDWMQEKGIYDAYRTVNSQSLNSLVKHEYDLAKERGEFDFKIPGLEIQQQTILSVRKK